MTPERLRQIEELYHSAREREPGERAAFLTEACPQDEKLRREVESLLASDPSSSALLEAPMRDAAAMLASQQGRSQHHLAPGVELGPYVIEAPLGAGGMGEIYRAKDKRLRRTVALTVLPPQLASIPGLRQRLEREAEAISSLSHPHICTLYDIGRQDEIDYLVMEFLEGETLAQRLKRGPLPLAEWLEFASQIGGALNAAHSKGIIHRDIKPANIFVIGSGQVKVLDFGLAKLKEPAPGSQYETVTIEKSLTTAGTVAGTVAYMSPEQARGEEVDARTDVFSFGVVLYEMATGRPPFCGNTPVGILSSILTESPEKPSALNAAIPAKVDQVILKALEKNREVRYQSAALLCADLEKWQQARATVAALRTRRWTLAAAGAGAASLAGGAFLARRWLFPPERRILIAVLPFENVGGNPQEAFLADGLHQDMISVMNRLYPDRLGVIARTSVKRYQGTGASIEQIGRDLKVNYVVEGGVQRDGSQAHVTARLIRVRDQTPLWNATYNRDLDQILGVQAEIAKAIAQGVERGLLPDAQVSAALARPLNAAAHEAYLRGDYAKAVEIDPGYAAAFAALANDLYYPALFGLEPPHHAFTNMMNAANKALELDPTQATAHASLALSKLHLQWRWSEAEEGLRRALRLDPSNADVRHFLAHLLLWMDRAQESDRECDRALELDPYDPDLTACIGWHHLCNGDDDKALDATRRALAFQPDNAWALMTLGWIYEKKGMYQEALSALRRASFDSTLKTASIAHAFARSGNRPTAEKILGELLAESTRKYISPYDIAVIYTGLDDKKQAFDWLSRASEERSGFLLFMNSDPRLKPLRSDPRFRDLLRRMGVTHRQA